MAKFRIKKTSSRGKLRSANTLSISTKLKKTIISAILKSKDQKCLANFFDHYTKTSYCISYAPEGRLTITVIDYTPMPNASLLPFMIECLGQPTVTFDKPWIQDPKTTIFYMIWEKADVERLRGD